MSPLEMIAEWRRGCSNGTPGPEYCPCCTLALIDAIERRFDEAVAFTEAVLLDHNARVAKLETLGELWDRALAVEVELHGETVTVREYLATLLLTLWDEQELFNSKRPFGNSDWAYDLYTPLLKAGFIGGKLSSDGYVQELDDKEAAGFVSLLIARMSGGSKP